MNFDRIRELVWEQTFQSSKLSSVLVMLEEVGKFISGRTPKSDELASIGDIPYFKVGDMNTEGNEKVLRITSLFLKEKAGKTFPAGAIVYPKNGGAVFTNKRRILATESVIDLNTGGFVCGERLNQAYTYMFFCGLDFRKISKGTALPTIDQKKLHQTKIPVPSLEEQSRIVTRLGEAFAEIDRAEKAYEELQTLAGVLRGQILQKAMHGELVPQLEGEALPVGVKDVLEHSLDVPKTWKVTKLGDLISIKSGDGLSRKQYRSGPIPVYGGNGVNGYHDCSNVEKNTLVIGRVGYYCGNVQKTREPAWVTDNALIVTFKHDANVDFYLYILNAMKLGSKTSQTAQPVITGKILKPMLVPVPPLEEQARIVAKVEELLKHVDALSAR